MPLLTVHELDAALAGGCQEPSCTHADHGMLDAVFLHPRCHPRAGTWVCYRKDQPGIVTVLCTQCRTPVVMIAVADQRQGATDAP